MKLSAAATDKQVLVPEEVDWPESMIHFPKASTPLQLSSSLQLMRAGCVCVCVCVWCTAELSCYIEEDMKLELLTPNRKQWNCDGFKHVIKFGSV